MKRSLYDYLIEALSKKTVFLVGARQVGKTTLGKEVASIYEGSVYLNYDVLEDRRLILQMGWQRETPLLVLDEIHKVKEWKTWLKGIIDSKNSDMKLLITGSVNLDVLSRGGDSLAGRYQTLNMFPVSISEYMTHRNCSPSAALHHLEVRGGFPEPCLSPEESDATIWRNQYLRGIIRDDITELATIQSTKDVGLLIEVLCSKVGSPLSIQAIQRDLGISAYNVKRYLHLLESLFIIFVIRPWHRDHAHASRLQPKVYFYDTPLVKVVKGDRGKRIENITAISLQQYVQEQNDKGIGTLSLHYFRTKDGAEVDFIICDDEPRYIIESKCSDSKPSLALRNLSSRYPQAMAIQLVEQLKHAHKVGNINIEPMARWLHSLVNNDYTDDEIEIIIMLRAATNNDILELLNLGEGDVSITKDEKPDFRLATNTTKIGIEVTRAIDPTLVLERIDVKSKKFKNYEHGFNKNLLIVYLDNRALLDIDIVIDQLISTATTLLIPFDFIFFIYSDLLYAFQPHSKQLEHINTFSLLKYNVFVENSKSKIDSLNLRKNCYL